MKVTFWHGGLRKDKWECLTNTGFYRPPGIAVTHVPHKYYRCTRVPRAHGKGRKTFWTYSTCLCLRHVGGVTVVLSKKGRNRLQHTKILVTNLAALTPSQVVCIYQKRWAIELLNWERNWGWDWASTRSVGYEPQ